jgi:hypothetical protein
VNVTGIELAPTPLSIPSRTLSVGGNPGLVFRSLVTDLVENIPAITPGPLDVAPTIPPDGVDAANKDKGKTSTGGLEDVSGLGNANNLSNDKKKNEKTESVVLPPPVAPLQEPAVVIASTLIIYEVPKPGPLSGVESDRVTSRPYKSVAVPFGPAIPGVTAPGADVAFALRLTRDVSELQDTSQAVMSPPQPMVVKFASVTSAEPGQLNPNQSAAITNAPGATPTTLKDSFSNHGSVSTNPALDRQAERPPGSWAISSPAPAAQNRDEASIWSWPSLPKQSAESIAAARPESGLLADQQFKSEPSMVAALGSPDTLTRQPDVAPTSVTLPVIARTSPRPIPQGESGTSHPEPKESKSDPAAKRELLASWLNSRHAGGNATGAEAPTRPLDTPGTPVTRADRSSAAELSASKVSSEPEIRMGIAPPPFRQISLKLSTDDSTRVNLDLIEKAGKVQVTVRTPDRELAKALQTDLGDLIGRLESKGFKTEGWIPAAVHQAAGPAQSTTSNGGFGPPQHSSAGQGDGQQRHQQNGSNQRQQARWTAQMDETLSADEARSES